MQRPFIGDHGRPFGTVAALLCLLLTVAAMVLGDVAHDLAGTASPFAAIAAGTIDAAQPWWGLLLASEIVRCVLAGAVLLAMFTLAGPVGRRSPARDLALLAGVAGVVCIGIAAHFSIEAAAMIGMAQASPYAALVHTLTLLGHAGVAIWAALTVREARAAGSLPGWVQLAGLAFAALLLASGLTRVLLGPVAIVALVWWGGIFLTLYRPQDRIAR